jgi:hypothetical protein
MIFLSSKRCRMLALLACLAMTANPSAAAFSLLLAQNRNQLCSL